MTEFRCGSCKEVHNLSQKARYCPNCGSSSLNLVVKEQAEPATRETIGVYSPKIETVAATAPAFIPNSVAEGIQVKGVDDAPGFSEPDPEPTSPAEAEEQPRRRSKRS